MFTIEFDIKEKCTINEGRKIAFCQFFTLFFISMLKNETKDEQTFIFMEEKSVKLRLFDHSLTLFCLLSAAAGVFKGPPPNLSAVVDIFY